MGKRSELVVVVVEIGVVAVAVPAHTSVLMAVLRSMGILRILRGCEYFFLRPIWLMLLEVRHRV